jgi:hypothetical protein
LLSKQPRRPSSTHRGINVKCKSKRTDGESCGMPPRASGFCYAHDSKSAAQRKATRRAGGRKRGEQLRQPNEPMVIEVDDGETPLCTFDEIETAQRDVALALLGGRLSSKDALARTRVLAALAERIKDTEREGAQ